MNDPKKSGKKASELDEKGRLESLRACVPAALGKEPSLLELAQFLPPDARILELAGSELKLRLARPKSNDTDDDAERLRVAVDFVVRAFTPSDILVAFAELKAAEQQTLEQIAEAGDDVPVDGLEATLAAKLRTERLVESGSAANRLQLAKGVRAFLLARRSASPAGRPAVDANSVEDAKKILRGEVRTPGEVLALAKKLKGINEFGVARRILARARESIGKIEDGKLRLELCQQHALCTYKDPDQPLTTRLDRALEILSAEQPLNVTTDPETLGIAGAIHKRKWEADSQRQHLEHSLAYYLRGYQAGVKKDNGYTGINAAYILDCLAAQESSAGSGTLLGASADGLRLEARKIREEILQELPGVWTAPESAWTDSKWWFHATLAEAAFGVGRYEEAAFWLAKAKEVPVEDWEYESTARQLTALARFHAPPSTGTEKKSSGFLRAEAGDDEHATPRWGAWMVIARFLGSRTAAESKFVGKVGLALSGGGFRASLFHIGVLARLAELDLLRSVEVLSCVSGGSIIGAHYYLELRNLLEEKADEEIEPADYIRIVERIVDDFLNGVQRNIRTRVAAEWWTNVKMFWKSNYSRTHRAGELYEEEIFARIDRSKILNQPTAPARLFETPAYIGRRVGTDFRNQLEIHPKNTDPDFKPKYSNWRRAAKVPQLILNATTLNTGHNWQFTASFMGEPPGAIDPSVDGNDRLRRMYYVDAPAPHDETRLGCAVGASACVPAIFEPLPMEGLYPDMTVRLVDGGVHDNQGVAGLLEQDANFVIVSDASGQMAVQNSPSSGIIGVPLRANDVLMARVRTAEAQDLRARRRSGLLRGLMFMHLKKDLDVDPIDWTACSDPHAASDEARPASRRGLLTSYGIRKDMQEHIAALRTDLDSFSEAEAFALMTSGYRMVEREFADEIKDIGRQPLAPREWKFLKIEKHLNLSTANDPAAEALLHQLKVGSQLAFKVWHLSPILQKASVVLGTVGAAILIWALIVWHATTLLTVGDIGMFLAVTALTALLGKRVMQVIEFRSELRRILVSLGFCIGGFLVARLHLWIFDPWFLRIGKVENLAKHNPPPPSGALRSALSVLIAVALVCGWLVYKSDRVQRRLLVSRAPVAQALAMREDGITRTTEWAGALEAARQRGAAEKAWRQLDDTLRQLPTAESEAARRELADKGHTETSAVGLSARERRTIARCAELRATAHEQLSRGRVDEARTACRDAIKTACQIVDARERSRALADAAKILAGTGDVVAARALADRCPFPTDTLGAYTAILEILNRTRSGKAAIPLASQP